MSENRETANTDAYPAIPPLAGVSPPAARKKPDLFHKKTHVVNFFVKKNKEYYAAAGESGFIRSNARFEHAPRNSCQIRLHKAKKGDRNRKISVALRLCASQFCLI
jgi:hypothetical protein